MEGGGGVEVRGGSGRRRITLLDQMSAIADGRDLSGLTLNDILSSRKQAVPEPPPPPPPPPPPRPSEPPIQSGRTLLDIIRDEDPKAGSCKEFDGNRDRKSWKSFKDRLRLKRTGSGAAWTSSVHIPTSDILSPRIQSQLSRRSSVRSSAESPHNVTPLDDASSPQGFRPQISLSRRSSCRFGPNASFASDPTQDDDASVNNSSSSSSNNAPPLGQVPTLRHQISRRHSTRYSPVIEDSVTDPTELPPPMREGSRQLSAVLAEERSLSAREAVAAQEAAEAAAAAAVVAADGAESTTESAAAAAPESEAGPQPVRMSLMDLLEETDRQMGFVGARYMMDDDEEEEYEEEEMVEEDGGGGGGGVEQNCCVCMVRHKGAAFIPCGHTFCRLCSRELWVSRGNCPLCNGFILEILDIF